MKLPPFLLDQWLEQKFSADPPIEFDLGSSTGPVWTLRELLALGGDLDSLLESKLFYTPPAGSPELREELARMEGVEPEQRPRDDRRGRSPADPVSSRRRPGRQRRAAQSRVPRQFGRRRIPGAGSPLLHAAGEGRFPDRPGRSPQAGRSRHEARSGQFAAQSHGRGPERGGHGSPARFLRRAQGAVRLRRGLPSHLSRPGGALGGTPSACHGARRFFESALPERPANRLDDRARSGPPPALSERPQLFHRFRHGAR